MKKREKKADVEIDKIIVWIIALLGLAVFILIILILRERGIDLIQKFLSIFRFGR